MSATFATSGFIVAETNIAYADMDAVYGPPPNTAFQRPSACSWGEYVLSCQPRLNPQVVENSSMAQQPWTYYLDLQFNQLNTSAPPNGVFGVDRNTTWGLIGPSSASRTQFLTAMEVVGALPYAFWFETPIDNTTIPAGNPVGPNTFRYFQVTGVGQAWDTTTIKTPTINQLPSAPVIDFAATVVDQTVYLFTATPGSSNAFTISCASFTSDALGANASGASDAPLGTFATLTTAGGLAALHSIDATMVLQPDGSAGANARIAVVASGVDTSGNLTASCWLFNPSDMAAAPTAVGVPMLPAMTMPPSPTAPNNVFRTALRAGWGSIPYASGGPSMVQSGLVLAYSEILRAGSNIWSFTASQTSVTTVDLASFQTPLGWTSLNPLLPNEPWGMTYLNPLVYPSGTCLFPVVIGNQNSKNAQYVLTLMASVGYEYVGEAYYVTPNLARTQSMLLQMPSYNLTFTQTCNGDTTVSKDYTGPDLDAAASAWVLLGVITGLPPYPKNASSVSVTIGNTRTQGNSTTFSTQATTNIDGKLSAGPLTLGGSVNNVLGQQNGSSNVWSMSLTNIFANTDGEGSHGWLVFAQPSYARANYTVTTWDGNNAGFSMNLLWCENETPSIGIYSFQLTSPNTPGEANDAWAKAVCQFPVDGKGNTLVSWPASTDIKGWLNYPGTAGSWNVEPVVTLSAFTVQDGVGASETLNMTGAINVSLTSTNTITASAGLDLLNVFKVGGSTSLMSRNEVGTNFSSSVSITVAYGAWSENADYSSLEILPQLYTCTGSNAPWVPTPYAQQRPWLLTWVLKEAVPRSAAPTSAPTAI